MRNQLKTVYGALALVAMFGLTSSSYGVPAFARQTGLDCNSCHGSAGYPTLNSFGAAFKAGGYTQANDDDLIGDGEALSIPKTLNMSLVYKVRNPIDINANGAEMPFENPDEIAILMGGKAAKNIGWLMEAGGTDIAAASFKLVFAPELGPVRLGIVPWFSDLTPGYVFETMSTGAVRNIRALENRKLTSAINAVNYGAADDVGTNGMNAGLGLYVWHPMFFAAFTPFIPRDGVAVTAGQALAGEATTDWLTNPVGIYARAAVTPSFGGMDLGVGVQYYGGAYADGGYDVNGDATTKAMSTIGVDVQFGLNAGIPMIFFVTYANDIENTSSSINILADLAVIPDVLMLDAAFRLDLNTYANAEDSKTGAGIGAKFHIVRNVKLEVDVAYTFASGDLQILPQIFGAF
jgi:hypothetical protein